MRISDLETAEDVALVQHIISLLSAAEVLYDLDRSEEAHALVKDAVQALEVGRLRLN